MPQKSVWRIYSPTLITLVKPYINYIGMDTVLYIFQLSLNKKDISQTIGRADKSPTTDNGSTQE